MHKPIFERRRRDDVTNLYFKGRFWKRTDDDGHLKWWFRVPITNFRAKPIPVYEWEAKILEKLYQDNKGKARGCIARFPRGGPLKALKFKELEDGCVKIWANDGGLYLGSPMEIDCYGHYTDEYAFHEVIGADGELEEEGVDEKLRVELEGILLEHLEESSESSESETHRRDNENQRTREKSVGPEITRTKYGVRLYSNDKKHYFGIGVWKSKNYPGHTTVCLYTAGRHLIYTLDRTSMKAFRKEVSRGEPT